jgi:hypothetical protein
MVNHMKNVSDLSTKEIDIIVSDCNGRLGVKPSRCYDCRYFYDEMDSNKFTCEHPAMMLEYISSVICYSGVHEGCPISKDYPDREYLSDSREVYSIIEQEKPSSMSWDEQTRLWSITHPLDSTKTITGEYIALAVFRWFIVKKLPTQYS